ncbi:MAG: DUF2339 domain-containing protein [Solibacillus sp.]
MKEEENLLRRIGALEKEVRNLRSEVQHLKQHVYLEPAVKEEQELPVVTPISPKQEDVRVKVAPVQPVEPKPVQEKRSLEETLTRALPRIFMVILVLGVLWGLKLVSDYGILSDSIKIIAGFALSFGLAACALLMEKKQKSRVVALSLYGGAFIVGILTTAAGAILYDVLGLYAALIIALLYIVYGVWISYVKENEALTVLVVFTSLLLPYLLEYMAFSAVIIGIFVVLLFIVVQIVIVKYKQQNALSIGLVFSLLALIIVSTFHVEQVEFFVFAIVLLYSVFLASFLRISNTKSKWHASLLFSFTIAVLVAINSMLVNQEAMRSVALLLMLGILCFVTNVLWQRKTTMLFDVVATLAVLTLLNLIAQLDLSRDVILLLLVTVAFAGLMLAIKHAITFMKFVYSSVFTMLVLFVLAFCEVSPFMSISHVTNLLVIIMLVLLYRAFLRTKNATINQSKLLVIQQDVWPVLIYVAALIYIWKIDAAYMPNHLMTYLVYAGIAISFVALLLIKRDVVGSLLPLIAATVYAVAALTMLSSVWVDEQAVSIAFMMRLLYIGLAWAIVVDVWKHGAIYKNYAHILEQNTEKLLIASTLISIFALFSLTNFMNFHELINWSTAVILNTVSIFVASCLALFLAAKRSYRDLKLTGIGLLFFGIVKMIFFDLSALDILIRSISFIVIGTIGLVVSNKLLGKGKDTEL